MTTSPAAWGAFSPLPGRCPQNGETLALLDFRHVQLAVDTGRWTLDSEHFTAPEAVSRLPAGR